MKCQKAASLDLKTALYSFMKKLFDQGGGGGNAIFLEKFEDFF